MVKLPRVLHQTLRISSLHSLFDAPLSIGATNCVPNEKVRVESERKSSFELAVYISRERLIAERWKFHFTRYVHSQ